ncbi:MAG: oligoendopeptidase F [Christensenellales bacterium]|jgi:oligoendopeptidase F
MMNQEIKDRGDVALEYTWKLENIYASDQEWEQDFERLRALLPALADHSGKLGDAAGFDACMRDMLAAEKICEYLFVYAKMRRDENNADATYQGMTDRAQGMMVELSAASSFVSPELAKVPDETLLAWAKLPTMQEYAHYLEDFVRTKAHILSEAEEKLLALSGEVGALPNTVFTMFNDADLRFPSVTMPDGTQIEITHGRYRNFVENENRDVRRQAYEKMYQTYQKNINTLAALYGGSVKKDVFYAKVRRYPSAIEAALHSNNVPLSVYDSLIEAVRGSQDVMGRYLKLRKKTLGLSELAMYDVYAPLISGADKEVGYEEAQGLIVDALAPLGEEYGGLLRRAFSERWIDVYENRGKTSGAYCWGAYGVHPYVLLNYQNTLDYVFTVAHELGHAMHSYYSDENNSYLNASYRIFVAEVASTVNEVLLTHHILNTTQDEKLKKHLLNNYLEQFRTTVFRQTMFAEFEKISHQMAQEGQPLTADSLSKVYAELNAFYYPTVVQDDYIAVEWARIPHFYRAFYVYQYATGFSAAVAIATRMLQGGPVEDYLAFLKSGGRDYPIELLKIAGVDLTSPKPVQDCMQAFADTLMQLEKILE